MQAFSASWRGISEFFLPIVCIVCCLPSLFLPWVVHESCGQVLWILCCLWLVHMRCLRVAVASVACCATAYMTHRHGQHRLGASNPHAEHLEPADEMPDIAHEPDGDDADFNPSEQNFNGGISADARAVLQSIGESILNLAQQSMSWKAANHNSWHPFNALGFLGARAAWQRISRENLIKWSRATAAKPISLFPDQGLIMKVLLDRIDELWVDGGYSTPVLAPCNGWLSALSSSSGATLCDLWH